MASALRKLEILVFDEDLAERWRVFEEDFSIYIEADHPTAAPGVRASILLNLAGTEAARRARRFHYEPARFDPAGVQIAPAESIRDPDYLLSKFRQLCELRTNLVMEWHLFFPEARDRENLWRCMSVH